MKVGIVFDDGSYGGLFDYTYSVKTTYDIDSDVDAILFTGGEDVDPRAMRTIHEEFIYIHCKEHGIPMIGICRGMQFLGWAEGCNILQHIAGHNNTTHPVTDWRGRRFSVKGDHHQCIDYRNEPRCLPILWSDDQIVESAWFPKAKAFGVQYHPEWMDEKSIGYLWFQTRVKELINEDRQHWH